MKQCYLLKTPNLTPTVIVRRTAAIGDSLAASVVADRLTALGYAVTFQTHPHNWCLLRRQLSISKLELPERTPNLNLDGCYEQDQNRRLRHFHEMFMAAAAETMRAYGVDFGPTRNCKPKILVRPEERQSFIQMQQAKNFPRPWVFICPKSNSYNVRAVPNYIWVETVKRMKLGTAFWLGTDPAPPGIVDLQVRHLDNLIVWLSAADLMVTVDTGPMHIAAALGIPIVAIGQSSSPELHLSDQCDFVTVSPPLDCLNCQLNVCPKAAYEPPCQKIDPDYLAAWINARIGSVIGDQVSAVVSVYRPDAAILNRCLDAVLPQVAEVIICSDQAGQVPPGVRKSEKIRFVKMRQSDVGYGRKANFGARHANGRYLLFLNDDCYLNPEAVAQLKSSMGKKVGVAAPLLKFKDNRIQHAGMVRPWETGGVGFGHLDYGRYEPTFKDEREVECVTGACILVDRRAFYEVDGHDENYYLYCEDTHFMMAVRRAGWRIVYNPRATGIHDEHFSTGKTPNLVSIMNASNRYFGQCWAKYFAHNKGNSGLGNFEYV